MFLKIRHEEVKRNWLLEHLGSTPRDSCKQCSQIWYAASFATCCSLKHFLTRCHSYPIAIAVKSKYTYCKKIM